MTIEYAVSIVSVLHLGFRKSLRLPGCFFASPTRIMNEMEQIGLKVQAIPVWDLKIDETAVESIILSQGPWNAVWNLLQALRHEKGSMGVRSEVQDWVVSPPPNVCIEMVQAMNGAGIRRIYHDLGEGQLVELHPGLDKSPEEIEEYCRRTGTRLVLDLRHLRRPYGQFELDDKRDPERHTYRLAHFPSPLWKEESDASRQEDEWRRVIRHLAGCIDVIHVQPMDGEDPEKFADAPFDSQTGILLIYALRQIRKLDPKRRLVLVAEYKPNKKHLLIPFLSRRLARKMRKAMELLAESVLSGNSEAGK